jgi:glycine/D-amino acid oxidase-like deaminating enzyme
VTSPIAVLGAGLQGTCVALELAARGCRVDLYDRGDACLTQTSAQNEGKIHLGYVYANDPSRRTARTMCRGALSFAPLMRRWLGAAFDRIPVSTPFLYAVHANSLVGVEEMQRHFDDCVALAAEMRAQPGSDYFGRDIGEPVRPVRAADWASDFDPKKVKAVFRTNEIAVDPEAVARLMREHVAGIPQITLRLRTTVVTVSPEAETIAVTSECRGVRSRERYDHVVNALWDSRLAIDASYGLRPDRQWLWRLRRNLRVEGAARGADIPSVTNVLGPYGDVVNFDNGNFYLSWYPAGRIGVSRDLAPIDWGRPDSPIDPGPTEEAIVAGLSAIVPAVAGMTRQAGVRLRLTQGIVFAWGDTDIDDQGSKLHQRYAIGIHSHGRYHSIDTGKYTTAPLFAVETADRITATA